MSLPLWLLDAPVRPFTPQILSGLRLWLSSGGIVPQTDTSAATGWTDQSGYGNSLSQATGTRQPTVRATGIGSRASVQGDNVDDNLFTAAAAGLGASATIFTVAVVAKTPAAWGGTRAMCNIGADVGGGSGKVFRWTATGLLEVLKSNVASVGVSTTILANSTDYVLGFTFTSPTGTFYVNGTSDGVVSTATTFGAAPVRIHVLAQDDATVSPTNGHVASIVYCDGVILGASDLSKLFRYLGKLYGITVA